MKALLFLALVLGAVPAWGTTWSFRVLLDEREIGTHRFTLTERGAERELVSEASFRVRFLGFNAYRYRHQATERWREGCLRSLVSSTDDNGTPYTVDWRAQGGCVLSFAYWNPKILGARELLNAQTGRFEAVAITALGEGRYRITGSKNPIELQYSPAGEWIALDSTVAGGRRLRYRLEPRP